MKNWIVISATKEFALLSGFSSKRRRFFFWKRAAQLPLVRASRNKSVAELDIRRRLARNKWDDDDKSRPLKNAVSLTPNAKGIYDRLTNSAAAR